MATHSSVLAWRIPGTEEPGGLPRTSSSCSKLGLFFVAVRGLLIAVDFLVAEHGLRSVDSVVVVQGFSCPVARGILVPQPS